jgi:hypothetical protein
MKHQAYPGLVTVLGCVVVVAACGSKAAEPPPAPAGPALPARVSASIDTDHGPATAE